MKRGLILLIIAFLIGGGTVGILYQEGIGGIDNMETAADFADFNFKDLFGGKK
ncbi:MAG: hypothetical protein IIZ61_02240 [Lachnospiraceae bacterium]|nr:hypothetical protein [Lachnospiraceae bacterium]